MKYKAAKYNTRFWEKDSGVTLGCRWNFTKSTVSILKAIFFRTNYIPKAIKVSLEVYPMHFFFGEAKARVAIKDMKG